MADPRQEVMIDYTNWRGERRSRRIRPTGNMSFDNNGYHPETQWLLEAVDVDTAALRTFALANIHSWKPTR